MKRFSTYKKAGVDIDKANWLISRAKRMIDTTRITGSMDSIGGFGGLFDPAKSGIKDYVLVASTDGVGTKLKVAQSLGKHDTIGKDLVAMSVNDVLCLGAKPLFFLDYFAAGKLDAKVWKTVIKGIVKACKEAGCSLLGGETAEMPGMYVRGEYDLAGFAVGIVDRKKIINGRKIKENDCLLGIASSGLHSNGYSLVRKILTKAEMKKYRNLVLAPTFIYVRPFFELARTIEIKGAAHITGGAFYDNIPRILPQGLKALVYKGSWSIPRIFKLICEKTDIKEKELLRTFNMGIGMVLAISERDARKAQTILEKFKLRSWVIGKIVKGRRSVEVL